MKDFYLLENDGHNTPDLWRFRDQAQAEAFLMRDSQGEETEMRPGFFDSEEEWVDEDGTSWTHLEDGQLYVHDMRGEP